MFESYFVQIIHFGLKLSKKLGILILIWGGVRYFYILKVNFYNGEHLTLKNDDITMHMLKKHFADVLCVAWQQKIRSYFLE